VKTPIGRSRTGIVFIATDDLFNVRIFRQQKLPGPPESGLRSDLIELAGALKIDVAWLREHTRYLQRALEWDAGGRQKNRLLSGSGKRQSDNE
jgi:hypothetical protein